MTVLSGEAVASAQEFNETEIRFHIIDPIMRKLGYPQPETTYIFLEEKLEYPYVHIGRRSKKDMPLGFPDYRAGVKGARGSFIVEAKAGSVLISEREIEQAHSYAAHAQVGANYFVLCNGAHFVVFATLSGPMAEPILSLSLQEINEKFFQIENILSPSRLEKNCLLSHDLKLGLAPGFGSSVRVRSGRYMLNEYSINFYMQGVDVTPHLRASVPEVLEMERQLELLKTTFEMRVTDGRIEREDDGRIVARMQFAGVTTHSHQALSLLGIDKATFVTQDRTLSINPENQTICESRNDFKLSKGTMMPQLFGGAVPIDGDLHGDMFIKASMYLSKMRILGEYVSLSNHRTLIPSLPPLETHARFSGKYELELEG